MSAKIDVDIRHLNAFGIQEPLEEKIIGERIDFRDVEHVGDKLPAAEPRPGPTAMPCIFRPMDEVLHDEEIIGEAGLFDDADLIFQPFAHFVVVSADFGNLPGQPLFDEFAQIGVRGFAVRFRKFRQEQLYRVQAQRCSARRFRWCGRWLRAPGIAKIFPPLPPVKARKNHPPSCSCGRRPKVCCRSARREERHDIRRLRNGYSGCPALRRAECRYPSKVSRAAASIFSESGMCGCFWISRK